MASELDYNFGKKDGAGEKDKEENESMYNKEHRYIGDVHEDEFHMHHLISSLIFIIIFSISVPYCLYKLKFYSVLDYYFVNTDLLATVVSFRGGPLKSGIFKHLYDNEESWVGYTSGNLINYIVLMGIAYKLITISLKKTKYHGLAVGAFIYLITYLFPTKFIKVGMAWIYNIFSGMKFTNNYYILWFMTFLIGFSFAILFMLFEKICIDNLSEYVVKLLRDFIFKL